jgi:hypothetical protein
MKSTLLLGVVLAAFTGGCSKPEEAAPAATNQAKVGENPLDAPTDYLRTVTRAPQDARKMVGTISINQAIQQFSLQEGRRPKDLDELVAKKYLPKLPEPPANMKFSYDAATGTVEVEPK